MMEMARIPASYDLRLVLLSIALAILAAYTALESAGRIRVTEGHGKLIWLTGGAVAMGSGTWAMHYTGMLAYRLPIPVWYHVPTVILSLLAGILASLIGLFVVSRKRMALRDSIAGSVLMGAGIAVMHYTGMASMRLSAMHHYNPLLFAASILLAVGMSLAALQLTFRFREERQRWTLRAGSAVIMGFAIASMHYMGMAAVSFYATPDPPVMVDAVDISQFASSAIVLFTLVLLGTALLAALVDRRLSAHTLLLQSTLSEERRVLRALIDNIPDIMFVKDTSGRFVLANSHLARIAGVPSPEEMVGKTDFDFFPDVVARVFIADDKTVMDSGEPLFNREERTLDSCGKVVHILTTKVPLRNEVGEIVGVAGVARDISERKLVEEALRDAEQKYRSMYEQAMLGIFQATSTGTLLSVNAAMAQMLGYDSAEDLMSVVSNIDELQVEQQQVSAFWAALLRDGQVRNFESQVRRKDGGKIWISSSAQVQRRGDAIIGLDGMCEDISERKVLHQQLLQAQKLESIGQLAAGIAHEINTPTQYIGDNARFLKDAFTDLATVLRSYRERLAAFGQAGTPAAGAQDPDVEYLLKEIPTAIEQTLDGVGRVSTLVSAMKEFSHPGSKQKSEVDLNRAIQSTIVVARNEWKYVADMETTFDSGLKPVLCLPGEINQVMLNLIVNAAHAVSDITQHGEKGKGKIQISTRACDEFVEIRVRDTGTGIPPEAQGRIFDPFFTTKEVGKGTGQGLSIARSVIVDKHQGSIAFETEPGKGTTFIIRLPYNGKIAAKSGERV